MGARINFIFRESEDRPAVVLYSHWGETEWQRDIAMALNHSRPRWDDTSYFTRMVISYLMQDSILDETGFGIYACNPNHMEWMDHPILIDLTDNTISHDGVDHKDIDSFISYNLPSSALSTVVASSAGVGVTSR